MEFFIEALEVVGVIIAILTIWAWLPAEWIIQLFRPGFEFGFIPPTADSR